MSLPPLAPRLSFVTKANDAIPLEVMSKDQFEGWLKDQPAAVKRLMALHGFGKKAGKCLLYDAQSPRAVALINDLQNPFDYSFLAEKLPSQTFHLVSRLSQAQQAAMHLGWGLAAYSYDRYKAPKKARSQLVATLSEHTLAVLEAFYLVRDLINTPAGDMDPEALEKAAVALAKSHKAKTKSVVGEALLKKNFPAIHLVGKGAEKPPRLVEFSWGNAKHPKLTLVGKGLTFDTGGLNIKPTNLMKIMKKDMGGAAIVLGLASLIMRLKLPVQLRVILGIAENSIDAKSMHPLDIVKTRKGLSVEIGHTDAEGRVVLADCLALACEGKPDLLIDFATLTGAARVGLGTEIAPFMTNRPDTYHPLLLKAGEEQHDPVWPLPLFASYRRFLASKFADLSNESSSGYGGAIAAGLFLQEFVTPQTDWIHFDIMAYNALSLAGHPKGGEAQGMLAAFALIGQKFGNAQT